MSEKKHQPAVYRPTGLPHYDGNPLIEALPPILSDDDVARMILHSPLKPTEAERSLPAKLRVHGVNRLTDAVIPLEIHLHLEDIFSQLLRHGYTGRHPFHRDTVAMLHASSTEDIRHSGFKSSASTMTLVGLSGMGKTTALNAIARLYPQTIRHAEYAGRPFIQTQVVWLKIECPHDGSLRGFCAAFFAALDEALSVNQYSKLMTTRLNISILLQRIAQLCRSFFIGALIIDELQHLNSARVGNGKETLLNFFVTLSNEAGIPLVYVGTNAMVPLFSGVLRNARRAVGMGVVSFDRFSADDDYWRYLVQRLWEYDWTGSPEPLTTALEDKVYDLTQGNTDFLVKLLTLAQRYVIYEGLPKVSEAILQRVYNEQMRLLHKPIEALRSGDPLQIADFEDMMPAKDQIAQMMNFDTARRARRADLALISNINATSKREKANEPSANPMVPVSKSIDSNIAKEIAESSDLDAALSAEGWIDDKPW
ncbi:transposase [Pseudomonas laurylsulfatiphila]|uniref:Transposase n=1 Tax=Pseudomonas laurylsulfatiphila TaxID=2011015 RepID=A0A2S6FIX3_9PSED|nr:ATP-binding protein [Pseudomonas laurylsulfatiphila]PPK37320.1 transposase [Pseudomonas laurylsulfatiphila]